MGPIESEEVSVSLTLLRPSYLTLDLIFDIVEFGLEELDLDFQAADPVFQGAGARLLLC
jgi:hypothetical protein